MTRSQLLFAFSFATLQACGAVYPRYTTTIAEAPPGMREGGTVSPPPDSVVRIGAASAEIPPQTTGGHGWDGQTGLPDPYVVIVRNGTEVYRSRVLPDTIRPEWNQATDYADLHIEPTDLLHVELRDDDGVTNDIVGVYDSRGLPSEARAGTWSMRFERGASLTLAVNPPPPHVGMGVSFEYRTSVLVVLRVEVASSANIAGLREGDRIEAIDGRPVSGMSEGEARQAMDAATIRDVALTVRHAGSSASESINIRRDALYPSR